MKLARFWLICGFFLFRACAIVTRLFWLQIVRHKEYVERAEKQQQRTFEVAPRRGILYDRNMHELAMTVHHVELSPPHHRPFYRPVYAYPIAGMHGLEELLVRDLRVRREAKQRQATPRPHQLAGSDVPVPSAQVRRLNNQRQPFFYCNGASLAPACVR